MSTFVLHRWRWLRQFLLPRVSAVVSIPSPADASAMLPSQRISRNTNACFLPRCVSHANDGLPAWLLVHLHRGFCGLDESSFKQDAPRYKDEVAVLNKIIAKSEWSRAMDALAKCGIRVTTMHVVDVIKMERDPKIALRFFVWAGHQEGYVHNAFAINAITRVWGHEKDFRSFLEILGNMHLDGYSMTPAKYLVLIKGYGWAGLTDVAMDVLNWMVKTGRRPNEKHFSCLLNALLKEQQFQTAESVLQRMKNVGVPRDIVTYTTLIDGYCKAKQIHTALKYFSEMVQNGVSPNAVTYAALFDGFCQNDEVDKSLKVYEDMNGVQMDTVALNILISGLCNHGHADKACNLLSNPGHKPNARTYAILVAALCKEKNFKDGRMLVEQALSRGFVLEMTTCASLLESLCVDCKYKEAFDLMNKLLSNENIPEGTTNKVIASLSKNGEAYSAYKLWYNILRYKSIGGDTYEALLSGLCQEGRLSLSKQVYNDMMSKGFMPSVRSQGALLDGYCRAGNLDEACNVLNKIVEKGGVPNTEVFNSLIHGFSKAAQLPKAMQTLQKMEDAGLLPTSFTYVSLINGYCKIRSPFDALAILNRMLMQGLTPDVATYTTLIEAFCKAKKIDVGHELLQDMRERGYLPSCFVYDVLIQGFCQLGRVDDAYKLVQEMLEAGFKPSKPVIEEISRAFQKLNRLKDAAQLIELLG